MRTHYLAVSLLVCVWFSDAGAQQASTLRLEADVRFLSDDMLEGREAGTRGYDLAALYVAEAFRGIGLDPGGDDDSYFQQVPLREIRRDPNGAANLTLSKGGVPISLTENESFFVVTSSQSTNAVVEAPAVFVGFGLVSEEQRAHIGTLLDPLQFSAMHRRPLHGAELQMVPEGGVEPP